MDYKMTEKEIMKQFHLHLLSHIKIEALGDAGIEICGSKEKYDKLLENFL